MLQGNPDYHGARFYPALSQCFLSQRPQSQALSTGLLAWMFLAPGPELLKALLGSC